MGERSLPRRYFVGGYPFQREVSRNALARHVTPFDPPSASLEESRRGGSNHVTAAPCRTPKQPDAALLPDPPLRYRLLPCQSNPPRAIPPSSSGSGQALLLLTKASLLAHLHLGPKHSLAGPRPLCPPSPSFLVAGPCYICGSVRSEAPALAGGASASLWRLSKDACTGGPCGTAACPLFSQNSSRQPGRFIYHSRKL